MESINLYTPPNVCKSCGSPIGHKWELFSNELIKVICEMDNNYDLPMRNGTEKTEKIDEITKHGEILNKLGVFKYC